MSKSEIRASIVDQLHSLHKVKEGLEYTLELLDKGVDSVEVSTLRANNADLRKRLEGKV